MREFATVWLSGALFGAVLQSGAALAGETYYTPPHLDRSYPNYQPRYPETAQVNGEQGDVVLDVYVGANGSVRKIRISRSSGFEDLDNAAIAGVLSWRYVPAVAYGDTASEWTEVTISYRAPTEAIVPPKGAQVRPPPPAAPH